MIAPSSRRSSRSRQRGQTLVEFALVMPVFLLLVFGIIDGARLVFLNSSLSQAAREGARQGSVEASWLASSEGSCNTTGGPVCPATTNQLKTDVVTAVNRMSMPFGSIPSSNVYMSCDLTTAPSGSWTASTCTSPVTGSLMSIRVTSSFTAVTPIIGQILGTIAMSGSATMTIN